MKRILIVLITLSVIILGCNKKESKESISEQISKNREKIINLKQENIELQKKLKKYSNGNGRRAVLVKIKKVEVETFEHSFQVNGSVEAIKEAFISAEMGGRIEHLYVSEGDAVKKGRLLVSLNSDVIKNNISELQTNLELARIVYKKRAGLWAKKIGSEVEFLSARNNKESLENRLKALKAQLAMTRIKAPIDGIVDRIEGKPGELAGPGKLLILMVNLDKVYINADVSEHYLPYVKKGEKVTVNFPSYPEISMEVAISQVGHTINPENRTFKIRLIMDNAGKMLKPNLISVLKIRDLINKSAKVVPSIVVKKDLKGSYLYVVKRDGDKLFASKVYVKEGMSADNRTIITEGLAFGQEVIVEGYNFVQNGSKVESK
jgi:RND family efflux transporter MFP subunit